MTERFDSCEICGARNWTIHYQGAIRDGVFGQVRADAIVARCGGCGVDRLDEASCPEAAIYETDAYRNKLREAATTAGHYAAVDQLQLFTQRALWPESLRGQTVMDVGAAGGAWLDHVKGVAGRTVAIEPSEVYHQSLRDRGYDVFAYAERAQTALAGQVDLGVSIQVIEHVGNPRQFLSALRPLLKPGGKLVISTPNRDDILMDLLPDFRSHFYRVVHRWYFDAASLADCAQRAGFAVSQTRFIHRYGMANAISWLRDRRPSGRDRMPSITPLADDLWAAYLEQSGRADCLYLVLTPQ